MVFLRFRTSSYLQYSFLAAQSQAQHYDHHGATSSVTFNQHHNTVHHIQSAPALVKAAPLAAAHAAPVFTAHQAPVQVYANHQAHQVPVYAAHQAPAFTAHQAPVFTAHQAAPLLSMLRHLTATLRPTLSELPMEHP
ncbi:unnamed protein product [Acanthoscelides obtectus]|uniref:Uncharacterized protein n=1 Tax=Acanthoscelides obtectus TaxID=200917 RepID=A0A9P0L0F3_ACAOB|nr:unnamed protein product [Acanthoscelides obtectus]CAK1663008.1 hypothetical protein AOBTE_LOCUS23426 [Acanthoscelides obtectus]